MGSAVGGKCLFSSNFEYANFVERCCVAVVAPGVNLLAGAAILWTDDFQVFGTDGVYETIVYCKRALHTKFFFKPC